VDLRTEEQLDIPDLATPGYFILKPTWKPVFSGTGSLRQVATRSSTNDLVSPKPVHQTPVHKPFQEFRVATIEELMNQLERDGEGIDVLTVGGVLHLTCGKPLENILVQTDAVKRVPGDLLAVYQYCKGCKVAVRVL
jgi:hypothetical protein